ncbi:nucleotidyl transferase AbiEii/AbiGii toxin family protein [Patescibacteria group bacterium]|nr:nucleotidyl transferase AbiEii/AbiGii toxin family protein [Patescibacteria group bacterium]
MLINDLKKIVQINKDENLPVEYIKTELKEALIHYTLNFIYNSPKWSKLIFGGGTALKIIGDTARLSEDLDLDYLDNKFDFKKLVADLTKYFINLGVKNITATSKGNGRIITLKFPILNELGLVKNIRNESDLLYLKIELAENRYSEFGTKSTPVTRYNLFYVVKNYDLETLFANKIGAILGRQDKIYQDKYDFRGRDFYDLIWFLQNNVKPNLKRVRQIVKAEHNKNVKSQTDIWQMLEQRIERIDTKGIYVDLRNLVKEPEGVKQLADNYLDIYRDLIKKIH